MQCCDVKIHHIVLLSFLIYVLQQARLQSDTVPSVVMQLETVFVIIRKLPCKSPDCVTERGVRELE